MGDRRRTAGLNRLWIRGSTRLVRRGMLLAAVSMARVIFDYQEFDWSGPVVSGAEPLTKPGNGDRVARLLPSSAATDPMMQSTRKYSLQLLACLVLAGLMVDATSQAGKAELTRAGDMLVREVFAAESALAPAADTFAPAEEVAGKKVFQKVPVTAYSSTPDQTDSTPFITASGTRVRDGVLAANFLPIGTRVKIPEIYGDKVFIVEDRMNARYFKRADIWMETRAEAKKWGVKYVTLEVFPR